MMGYCFMIYEGMKSPRALGLLTIECEVQVFNLIIVFILIILLICIRLYLFEPFFYYKV